MSKSQFIYGAIVTLALDALLLITGLGGEIIVGGLYAALLILFVFINIIKIMITSTDKSETVSKWDNIGSYAVGSGVMTVIVMVLCSIAIV